MISSLSFSLVDGPLRYQMEEARVGRSSRRFRGYSPRGPGVVELLAVPRGWHSLRVAAGRRYAGHLRPGNRLGNRSWHLRPGHRTLARTTTPLPYRRQGTLDFLVWRGTWSLWSRVTGTHRVWWVMKLLCIMHSSMDHFDSLSIEGRRDWMFIFP